MFPKQLISKKIAPKIEPHFKTSISFKIAASQILPDFSLPGGDYSNTVC